MKAKRLCLLIGNSRWHWAQEKLNTWEFFHTSSNWPNNISIEDHLFTWAAVGKIPPLKYFQPKNRITLEQVPLPNTPPWVGVDRALAGWEAWKKSTKSGVHKNGLLIADAGTVLSLTRINSKGEFAGGQLIPGLRLQISAMANSAYNLKNQKITQFPETKFPFSTNEAMLKGTLQALLGVIIEAQITTQAPLWLCGGDAPILKDHLKQKNILMYHHPNLALEGMISIQGPTNQVQYQKELH